MKRRKGTSDLDGGSADSLGDKVRKDPSKQSYSKLARVGAVWSIVRQAGHEVIAIPTSVILARLLAPDDFGIAAAATFFIVLSSRLTQFGFNAAIVRIRDLRPEHTSSVFLVNLVLGVLTYSILLTASPIIGQFLKSAEAGSLIPLAALSFLFNPFGTVPAALITRRMQFGYGTACDWTDAAVGNIVTLVLAFQGYGFWSIPAGQVSGTACQVVLKVYLSGWRPTLRFSRPAIRELLSFGLGLQTKRLLEFATFNLDTLVVGRVLGMTALGYYDKGFATMDRIVKRLTLGNAYFRIFSIIHEEPLRFRRAYSRLLLTISMIGVPAFASAIVMAEPLFMLLYGKKWLPAVLPFQMLCVGGLLKLLNTYAGQANEATGNIWPQVQRQAIGAGCIVIGAMVGAMTAGVTGAATGVAAGMAILTVSMQALVRRITGLTWGEMLWPQIPALTCTALLVVVLLATEQMVRLFVPEPAAWLLLGAQALCGGIGYALFVLFNPFSELSEIVTDSAHQFLPERIALQLDQLRGISKPAPTAPV
jgi:PST family polysaccharide transporter